MPPWPRVVWPNAWGPRPMAAPPRHGGSALLLGIELLGVGLLGGTGLTLGLEAIAGQPCDRSPRHLPIAIGPRPRKATLAGCIRPFALGGSPLVRRSGPYIDHLRQRHTQLRLRLPDPALGAPFLVGILGPDRLADLIPH